jgi:DNA-binding transcriptional regulator GbsR (MarR family)
MITLSSKSNVRNSKISRVDQPITHEDSILNLCVKLCSILGLPKSIGLIYGAVFVSPKPIEAGQICRKLKISRGSVSQGLKFLKELGAIRSEGLSGNRAEHFLAEDHLRKAVEIFVTKKIGPAFDELGGEVVRLEKDPNLNLPQELREKLETIRRWHSHGQLLLPLVTGFLRTMPLLTKLKSWPGRAIPRDADTTHNRAGTDWF